MNGRSFVASVIKMPEWQQDTFRALYL